MDARVQQQLEKVLDGHRSKVGGEPLAPESRKRYRVIFERFVEALNEKTPGRTIASFSDFTAADLAAYQQHLEQSKTSAGTALKSGSITGPLMALKGIFNAAHKAALMAENIASDFKPRWHPAEEGRRLMPDEVERLCKIDETNLKNAPLLTQFLHLRNVAMLSVQKDAALRAGEVLRLCDEDILWGRRTQGGIVPILIRESKGRLAGSSETVALTPWATVRLKAYLEVRHKFFQAKGMKPAPMMSAKSGKALGSPLFINQSGGPLDMARYQQVFNIMCDKAKLEKGYSTHDLRHTRVCEWVDAGLNPRKVQHLARHKDVQLTLERYYHTSEKEIFADLDGLYGSKAESDNPPLELLPLAHVRRALFRHALRAEGHPYGDEVLDRLDHSIIAGPAGIVDLFYTVHETCAKISVQRTQLYAWIKAGHLRAHKLGSRTVFLRKEVDALSGLRTTEDASRILGYREKRPTTILRFVSQGHLPAVKIGKTLRFRDHDLIKFLREKNSGRLRLVGKGNFLRG